VAIIELHPDAEQEVNEATEWHDGPGAGVGGGDFELEVDRCLSLIAEAPERWSVYLVLRRAKRWIRRYVMQKYPYILYYYVEGEVVTVVALHHTSRRPDLWIVRVI
jgi:toxin ParE1/3/4